MNRWASFPMSLVAAALWAVMLFMTPHKAHALGLFDPRPGPWSLEREKGCAAGNVADCYLWLLDPPTTAVKIGFEIHYDSSKMTILPALSGFLCDFSNGGSCPLPAPGTSGNNGASIMVGGPRSGTTYSFNVTANTITLDYDMTANPAPLGSDQNFFAIAFTSPYPNVAFTTHAAGADFYQVSTFCQTTDPSMSCKSNHPIYGATLLPVPEPDGWLLALIAVAPVSLRLRRPGQAHMK